MKAVFRFTKVYALLVMAATSCLWAGEEPEKDGWSKPVNGLQARITFGEGEMYTGTRLARVYLELHNALDSWDSVEFVFQAGDALRFEILDADSNPPPQLEHYADVADGPGTRRMRLIIPHDGTLKCAVDWRGHGVGKDSGTMFGFEPGKGRSLWIIPPGDLHDYFLKVTLTIPKRKRTEDDWHGTVETPPTKVPTKK